MIYLASPYTSPDSEVMEYRHASAEAQVAYMLKRRMWVYSPIVHCHALAKNHDLPKDARFWQDYDWHMLARADELFILGLAGWTASLGVLKEVEFWMSYKHDAKVSLVVPGTRNWLYYEADLVRDMMINDGKGESNDRNSKTSCTDENHKHVHGISE